MAPIGGVEPRPSADHADAVIRQERRLQYRRAATRQHPQHLRTILDSPIAITVHATAIRTIISFVVTPLPYVAMDSKEPKRMILDATSDDRLRHVMCTATRVASEPSHLP